MISMIRGFTVSLVFVKTDKMNGSYDLDITNN